MANKADKTYVFAWEGKDKTGRVTQGEITSSTIALAKAELRKQGVNPTKVRKKGGGIGKKKKIKPMDIALFTRQLATMTKAGVPLIQAFEITADGTENPTMQELIVHIKNDVAGGTSFAQSLRKHPQHFDELYCNLIHSGEQSGALEALLDRIATYKEKTEALKAKIKKAMNYPIAVTAVAVIVTGILLVKVVPQFEDVFAGFGAELPAFTQFVIKLSDAVQEWWFIILATIIGGVIGAKKLMEKSHKFRDKIERNLLKVPIIGAIIDKSSIARFARTLSTTFAAGVPLVDALESVSGATGNVIYRDAVNTIREDISSGQQLQFSMRSTGVFPAMAVQMVAIGEESGTLDEMLGKVANFYEDEVDNMVDSLTSLMEPMIMVVLGTLVGGLIVAMYLPIFQLGSVV